MNRSRTVVLSCLACAAFIAVLIFPGAASAEGIEAFSGEASAQAIDVNALAKGGSLVQQVLVSAPSAYAHVDSNGLSSAFGAYPFPGNDVIGLPGTLKSLLPLGDAGNQIPPYPLIAQSSYPVVPKSDATFGVVGLSARSQETSSSGLATGGGIGGSEIGQEVSAGLTQAAADVTKDSNDTVTSIGETTVEGLSFMGDTLRIARVHSIAKAVLGSDGKDDVTSSLDIGKMSIAGMSVGFTDKGLVLPGTTTPIDLSPLKDVLKNAGITLTFIAPLKDADGKGITAAGLSITFTGTDPLPGTLEPPSITYTLGRASARAEELQAIPLPPVVGGGVVQPPVAPPPAAQPVAPTFTPPTNTAPVVAAVPPTIARVATDRNSIIVIYLVLAIGAVTILGGGLLIRMLGVKLAWTS